MQPMVRYGTVQYSKVSQCDSSGGSAFFELRFSRASQNGEAARLQAQPLSSLVFEELSSEDTLQPHTDIIDMAYKLQRDVRYELMSITSYFALKLAVQRLEAKAIVEEQ